jgi:hypothetical protein
MVRTHGCTYVRTILLCHNFLIVYVYVHVYRYVSMVHYSTSGDRHPKTSRSGGVMHALVRIQAYNQKVVTSHCSAYVHVYVPSRDHRHRWAAAPATHPAHSHNGTRVWHIALLCGCVMTSAKPPADIDWYLWYHLGYHFGTYHWY